MIRVPKKALPKDAAERLRAYQAEVDSHIDYPGRVAAAKAHFAKCNRPTNPAFKAVRSALHEMCFGARRCMYCDDSLADEVEHIRPKDLYPEAVFAWKNYLDACGPCNGPKNNRFSVISRGRVVDVTRRRGDPIQPPRRGEPALINPRIENPLDFFMLDLVNTFEFVIISPPESMAYERARHTLDVLRLNERDYLKQARRGAFDTYHALLRRYCGETAAGNAAAATRITDSICKSHHATVWAEMKRQRNEHRALNELFQQAPGALVWPLAVK